MQIKNFTNVGILQNLLIITHENFLFIIIGKQDNDCSTLAVPNGKIKRKVNCVNGKHVLKVSCLPGYTLYGRKKFTCNGGITGPPGMWPPSCVPDSGKCHTMICVLYHTEMKPTYHVI